MGAFGVVTDRFVFVSPRMSSKDLDAIERTFNLPLVQSTIATMDTVGLVIAANSNGIVVPYTTSDDELETIRQSAEVPVDWIDNKMTALGNIIITNDNGAICHPEFDKVSREKIADVLGVEVVPSTIAKLPIVGANMVATNNGAVVHPMASVDEIERVSQLLKVEV